MRNKPYHARIAISVLIMVAAAVLGWAVSAWLLLSVGRLNALPALLLGLVGGLSAEVLAAWLLNRWAVQEFFTQSYTVSWSDALGPPADARVATVDRELQGLGYHPAGALVREEAGIPTWVYIHKGFPVYALLSIGRQKNGLPVTLLHLESFFEDGGRLTATQHRLMARFFSGVDTGVPRLVQLRTEGSATALDGQHMGTLKAWMVGGRKPLPATREALIGYLTEDRRRLKESRAGAGWLPFPLFLRGLYGEPPGILKF
jgi:hypothetical protein